MVLSQRRERLPRAQEESLPAGVRDAGGTWVVLPPTRDLTPGQVEAVRTVMRLFVDDDLANGVSPRRHIYCDVCHQARPMPGFIRYERHLLCNPCATEYEMARTRGLVATAEQFVRDKPPGGHDSQTRSAP